MRGASAAVVRPIVQVRHFRPIPADAVGRLLIAQLGSEKLLLCICSGGWRVTVEIESQDGAGAAPAKEEAVFDGVVICNGHYSQPRVPDIDGINDCACAFSIRSDDFGSTVGTAGVKHLRRAR